MMRTSSPGFKNVVVENVVTERWRTRSARATDAKAMEFAMDGFCRQRIVILQGSAQALRHLLNLPATSPPIRLLASFDLIRAMA
jgi:hypothetical protein